MTTWLRKYSVFTLVALLLVLFILAWLFPSAGFMLGLSVLLVSFLLSSFVIVHKYQDIYRTGGITRGVFMGNAAVEIIGAGLAMILAGLGGKHIAAILTHQINDDFLKFLAGILIGLATGLLVGTVIRQIVDRGFLQRFPR